MPLATKKPKSLPPQAVYERDFYSWALRQGELLRAGRLDAIDRGNLAEEIEGLARSEFDKLVSFYRLILLHMLKWDHQPEKRSRSWAGSIRLHRIHARRVLEDNPGLKSRLSDAMERAYEAARVEASIETGLPEEAFPEGCPYSLTEIDEREISPPSSSR
jgi:hypothetical protein